MTTKDLAQERLDLAKARLDLARLAGMLYLAIAVFGGFSMGYLPTLIVVAGDAGATANNIAANMGLFRFGMLCDVIVIVCEIVLTVILYNLLKPVGAKLSLMAAMARFGMVMVMGVNLINYLVPMVLVGGAAYLDVFDPQQREALALLFLEAHQYGVYVWGLFFGIHLMLLGYLVAKSEYLPRVLGWMLVVGSFGYTLESLGQFVVPGNGLVAMAAMGCLAMAVVGELSFAIWLLAKGVDARKWADRQGARG